MLTGLVGVSSIISIVSAETQALRSARGGSLTSPGAPNAAGTNFGGAIGGRAGGSVSTAMAAAADPMAPLTAPPPLALSAGAASATPRERTAAHHPSAASDASSELEVQIEELGRLLRLRRRACAPPSTAEDECLACLEETAMSTLATFARMTLRGTGVQIEAAGVAPVMTQDRRGPPADPLVPSSTA